MQVLVLGLVTDKPDGPADRHARTQDDRKLIAHQRERLFVQLVGIQIQKENGFLFLIHLSEFQNDLTGLFDAVCRIEFIVSLDNAVDFFSA